MGEDGRPGDPGQDGLPALPGQKGPKGELGDYIHVSVDIRLYKGDIGNQGPRGPDVIQF